MTTCLEAALYYAKQGWFVLPVHGVRDGGACECGAEQCSSQGKHPIASAVRRGLDDATTDAATIKEWWRVNPTANVAIRTGVESGLVVADFDGDLGVELAASLGSPLSPRVTTGSGGKHRFYLHPGYPVGNRAKVVPGLDIRADRGYVVAVPSRHTSGGTYTWDAGFTPEDTDLAPLPENLLELLAKGKNPVIDAEIVTTGDPKKNAPDEMVERAKAYVAKIPGAISGQGGHDDTFVVAIKLIHGFQLSDKQAMTIFKEYGARCKPPWSLKELEHKLASARKDANDPAAIAKIINPNAGKRPWLDTVQMTQTKHGFVPIPILANAIIYVTNDVNPIGTPRKDSFSGKLMIGTGDSIRGYTDHDLLEITNWLQHEDRKMYSGKDTAQDAVAAVAGRNAYHPVRDYLASLVWDGKERIETWLIRLAGARDDAYVRAASKKWLIGAVARVFKPGCRMDTMLVLEGKQGSRKSTTVDILGRPWAGSLQNQALHSESAVEGLQGKWIVELAELDGLRRSEVTAAKDFISRVDDYYREKYGRVATAHPRQNVLIGTVNDSQYLIDPTGNRRFLPIRIERTIDTDGLTAERDALWAEAVAAFYAGVPWHLDASEEALANDEQAQRVPDDAWESTVLPWLLMKIEEAPLLRSELSVSTAEVLKEALAIDPSHQDKQLQMRVAPIMKKMGWEKKRMTYGSLQQNRWIPPAEKV